MSNELSIQDRIDIVKGKVESLVQTGIAPGDIVYIPAEFKGLTALEFAELSRALPGMTIDDGGASYSGYLNISGVHTSASSAYGTRKAEPATMRDELDALIASAQQ